MREVVIYPAQGGVGHALRLSDESTAWNRIVGDVRLSDNPPHICRNEQEVEIQQ